MTKNAGDKWQGAMNAASLQFQNYSKVWLFEA
jgi:hypothetical protein